MEIERRSASEVPLCFAKAPEWKSMKNKTVLNAGRAKKYSLWIANLSPGVFVKFKSGPYIWKDKFCPLSRPWKVGKSRGSVRLAELGDLSSQVTRAPPETDRPDSVPSQTAIKKSHQSLERFPTPPPFCVLSQDVAEISHVSLPGPVWPRLC